MAYLNILATAAFVTVLTSSAGAEDKEYNHTMTPSSCRQSDCLRCDRSSNRCSKCIHMMMMDTRTCLQRCPHGFDPIWAEDRHHFGKICQERSVLAMVSYREVGIIAGASVLGAICVGVFLGVLLLRRKGAKLPPDSPPRGLPKSLQDKRPKTAEVVVKGKERTEFLARLRPLRSDAPYIFRMMAATRNRFRSGSAAGHEAPSDAKTKACKAVIRDLSRVLCLLGLKEDHLQTAPKDWRGLLSWTERLLARYKRQEELKAMGEGFGEPINNTTGCPPANRSLFVTRQQQVKAEQEKRRLEAKSSLGERTTDEGAPPVSKEAEEGPPSRPLSPLQLDYKNIYNKNEPIIPQTHHGKLQVQFTPEDLPLKKDPENKQDKAPCGKENKMKIKEFLNLNKILWLKLFSRSTSDNDLEKGREKSLKDSSSLSIEDFGNLSPGTDDISSEIFFDHIEAFVFDIEELPEQNDQTECDTIEVNEKTNGDPKGTLTSNKKYKNNLELYKNYKNSRLLSGSKPIFSHLGGRTEIWQNQKQRGHLATKEKKPGKLRRLSSSILSKDKRPLTLARREATHSTPQKRRPLKRQKQVEKEKRSKIHEKYQNKTFEEDSNCSSKEHQSTVEVLNTSINQTGEGVNDLYLSVIKTPVSRRQSNRKMVPVSSSHIKAILGSRSAPKSDPAPFEAANYIQQSDDSKIKIMVPHRKCGPEISNDQNTPGDTRHHQNSYPKCEVLTDV